MIRFLSEGTRSAGKNLLRRFPGNFRAARGSWSEAPRFARVTE